MAAVKDVFKHLHTEVAGRSPKCNRKRTHSIVEGETCLVVHDRPQSQTTDCAVCAVEILAKASESLAALHAQFVGTPASETPETSDDVLPREPLTLAEDGPVTGSGEPCFKQRVGEMVEPEVEVSKEPIKL